MMRAAFTAPSGGVNRFDALEFFRARPCRDECRHRPTGSNGGAARMPEGIAGAGPGGDADALGFTHVVVREASRSAINGAASADLAGRKMQCAQGG
jgi:hypothetical protein